MRLKKITLHNIGPFVSSNSFDLEPKKDTNIILIGGKNGAGKTTILNSLKIGLFGSHSFGLTTNTDRYLGYIRKLLNNRKNKRKKFFIKIIFEETNNLNKNQVEIKRSWEKGTKIKEFLQIRKNNKLLSNKDTTEYINNLKERIQPELLSSLVFDGEKVASQIEAGNIKNFLSELVSNAFGLDLFNTMTNDLEKYIEKEKENQTLSKTELQLFDKRSELKSAKEELSSSRKALEHLKKTLMNNIQEFDKRITEYRLSGGLTKEEQNKLKEQIRSLEGDKDDKRKDVNDFLENYYAFAVNEKLLLNAKDRIIKELPGQILNLINQLSELKELSEDIDFSAAKNSFEEYGELEVMHNLNLESVKKIDYVLKELKNGRNIDLIESRFKALKTDSSQVKQFNKKFNNSENKELSNKLLEITKLSANISSLRKDKKEKIDQIKNLELKNDQLLDEFEMIEKEVFSEKKSNNSFNITNKIIDINNKFVEEKKKNIINQIEKLLLSKFVKIIRKKKFFSRVKINPVTFDIKLFNFEDEVLDIESLSAGEKQILMACLITSVYELSRISMPFVFDTPLARLDTQNRASFIKSIVKDCSYQVLLLSTDEEIVGKNLDIIRSNISHTYLLKNYDKSRTEISNDYFGGKVI